MTGHPMGVCFEDVIAVLALDRQEAPPLANFRTADPALEAIAGGKLRLSAGGAHDAQYALHFAAGFGSQVAYVLYKRADEIVLLRLPPEHVYARALLRELSPR